MEEKTHEHEDEGINFGEWIICKVCNYIEFCREAFPCKWTADMEKFIIPDLEKIGAPFACLYLYTQMIEKFEGKPDEWVEWQLGKFGVLDGGKEVTEEEKAKLRRYHVFFDKALDVHFNEIAPKGD